MTPEQMTDIENRLRADYTKTLNAYRVTGFHLGPEMYALLLDELVMDAFHQIDRLVDWPEGASGE